jgi:hypothetical protein
VLKEKGRVESAKAGDPGNFRLKPGNSAGQEKTVGSLMDLGTNHDHFNLQIELYKQ